MFFRTPYLVILEVFSNKKKIFSNLKQYGDKLFFINEINHFITVESLIKIQFTSVFTFTPDTTRTMRELTMKLNETMNNSPAHHSPYA